MNCVADEGVDASIVRALRQAGYEVWSVAEEARSITDEDVLEKAHESRALLLTGDKDFGDLVFRQGRAYSGVLLLRLAGMTASEKATAVTQAMRDHAQELTSAFSVLTRRTLRVRPREPHQGT